MKQQNYSRYFRVFKNDTVITEISTNDFQPLKLRSSGKNWLTGNSGEVLGVISDINYSLPPLGALFYGYRNRVEAMKAAKAGALSYINSLIDLGEAGAQTLRQYRIDHYEDLNINLLEANINYVEHDSPKAVNQHLL